MSKRASLLLLLFILQKTTLVSSVSFTLNIDQSNSEGVWELSSDDYRNLEEGNPGATLKSGTNFPYDPVKRYMRIHKFTKLMISKPISSNVTCDQDFVRWFESMDPSRIPACVGATVSIVGIRGPWSIMDVSLYRLYRARGFDVNPTNLEYLVGGNATIRMSSSKENVSHQGSDLVKPTHIFSQWTNLKLDSNLRKVSVEATVKNDAIMLLLDVILFDHISPFLFGANESRINYQFDWKPDGLQIRETRDICPVTRRMICLTVQKQVYPESWEEVLHPHAKGKCFGISRVPMTQNGQVGPAKPAEAFIVSAVISVAYAHAIF